MSDSKPFPVRGRRRSLAFCAAAAVLSGASGAAAGQVPAEVVASFDASRLEAPENIAIDSNGDIYISLALTGEIRKISHRHGTQSTFATLPLGAPPLTYCGSFFAGLTGLAIDHHDNLYAALASCDPARRGIWKITPDGAATQLVNLPMESLPNGIALRRDRLYVADSVLGVVWRLSAQGPGPIEVWADDPLLQPADPSMPGPNGVQFFHDELFVSNSSSMQVLAISLGHHGNGGDDGDEAAAAIRVHAQGAPCDDFAFDVHGALYCGTDPFDTLVRFAPDGSMSVLLTAADGLDGTTSAIFGRGGSNRRSLFVTNGSFPFFPTSTHKPSLMRVDLEVLGYPRP